MNKILNNNTTLTIKDKVYGPVCPKCNQRTGRPKIVFAPIYVCPRCGITLCFRQGKKK